LPPPTIRLHGLGGRDESIGDFIKVRFVEVVTEDEAAGTDPARGDAFGSQVVLKHPVIAAWLGVQGCPHGGHVCNPNW